MTIDTSLHKTILFQILKEIYTDTTIAPFLGFKGGTAAMIFYGLDRFSVDLDFDLLDENKQDRVFARIKDIAKIYGQLKDSHQKRHSLFILLSYEDTARNIKIEINLRQFNSQYELKSYLGLSMLVMVPEDMFAHKLMAMYERIGTTSRDIYDVWFFLKHRFPINTQLVEERAQMNFDDLVNKCVKKLDKVKPRHLLDGMGELLTEGQKDWARVRLKEETIALLLLRIGS